LPTADLRVDGDLAAKRRVAGGGQVAHLALRGAAHAALGGRLRLLGARQRAAAERPLPLLRRRRVCINSTVKFELHLYRFPEYSWETVVEFCKKSKQATHAPLLLNEQTQRICLCWKERK